MQAMKDKKVCVKYKGKHHKQLHQVNRKVCAGVGFTGIKGEIRHLFTRWTIKLYAIPF